MIKLKKALDYRWENKKVLITNHITMIYKKCRSKGVRTCNSQEYQKIRNSNYPWIIYLLRWIRW